MRLFVDRVSASSFVPLQGPLWLRVGAGIDEIEWRTGLDICFVLYRIPTNSSTFLLASCCGDAFDPALVATTGFRRRFTPELARYWPNLAQMLVNGQYEDLSDRGLVRIVDPNDNIKKSFVATSLQGAVTQSLKTAAIRVIEGAASAIGQGVDAAAVRPEIAKVIAPARDFQRINELLEALSYVFSLGHLDEEFDRH